MADNIKTYNAPGAKLNPSDLGIRAVDLAGRRLGPLYNQAASDVRERGALTAKGIKDRIWPYDIYALNEKQLTASSSSSSASSSGGFKVAGGFGAGTFGQVGRGAKALGDALSDGGYGMSAKNTGGSGKLYDVGGLSETGGTGGLYSPSSGLKQAADTKPEYDGEVSDFQERYTPQEDATTSPATGTYTPPAESTWSWQGAIKSLTDWTGATPEGDMGSF